MGERAVESVADTAFMVAAWRAEESARPDALFRDPLAARLVGAQWMNEKRGLVRRFGAWLLAVRTVIIDELIQAAIAQGLDTVVNLGAGLDTRPYRMSLPASLRWLEVDRPETLALKNQRLAGEQPNCKLERLGLDLTDLAARRALLESLGGKTLALTEGVIPYLRVEDVGSLADDLRASPVSAWIVDYVSPWAMRHHIGANRAGRMRKAPFRFTPDDWFGFFDSHGWRVREMRYLLEEAERLGRPPPLPGAVALGVKLLRNVVPSARREAFRHLAGFAVLERP